MADGKFPGLRGVGILAAVFAATLWAQDDTQSSPEVTENAVEYSGTSVNAPGTDISQESRPAYDPGFRLHVYSDIDFLHSTAAGQPNRFSLDEIDLFGTAPIAPRFSALTELVLNTGTAASLSSVSFNVERLLLQYRWNDYLTVEAGQFRTSVGYYSTAYLRGAWFQTAITRPRMFAFEEDGGVLPLHTVGVSASGQIPSGALGLHYVVETGNTRTWGVPGTQDPEGHDAINFFVFARPRPIPGLQLGFADYHDHFAPIPGFNMARWGVSAHVVYVANRFEFLNEGIAAYLDYAPAHAIAAWSGFYSQLGYRVGPNWGPYVRVEKLSVQAAPLLFSLFPDMANWRSMYTAGVRYDWNAHVAVKLEGAHEADWGAPHYFQAAMQVAFAF